MLEMQNKLRHYETTIRNANNSADALKKDLKEISEKQFEGYSYMQNLNSRLGVIESDKELSKKFMGVVDEINNGIGFISTYIDKYLPLFIQAQLSDTLSSFITDKQRKVLCVYEEKAFEAFNNIIIGNQGNGLA